MCGISKTTIVSSKYSSTHLIRLYSDTRLSKVVQDPVGSTNASIDPGKTQTKYRPKH